MKYINIEECLSKIDEKRIDYCRYPLVYAGADTYSMVVAFSYKEEDEIDIVRITSEEETFTEEMWQEFLLLSMIISNKFGVKRVVDNVWNPQNIEDTLNELTYDLKDVTIKIQIDGVQEKRLQRLADAFNDMGFNMTKEDALQAIVYERSIRDVDEKLLFYESMLLDQEEVVESV